MLPPMLALQIAIICNNGKGRSLYMLNANIIGFLGIFDPRFLESMDTENQQYLTTQGLDSSNGRHNFSIR